LKAVVLTKYQSNLENKMGFLSKIGKSAKSVAKQNVFEAIVAASVLVAAADGEIEKKESEKLEKMLSNNDSLSSFKKTEIQRLVSKYSGTVETDFRMGKIKMLKEIEDIAENPGDAEEVFVTAISIAEADGEIEPKELDVLIEIGRRLGLNLKDYGIEA
jgi:tellurite resistance protein TerB